MEVAIYQVDAFALKVFEGNPAAVCPLDVWLEDSLLQQIAMENNLSETAFVVASESVFHIRWFTPNGEVDLCGHATLAAAHVMYTHMGYTEDTLTFSSKSGHLVISKTKNGYQMDFPATLPSPSEVPTLLAQGIGVSPVRVLKGFDYIVVLNSEADVKNLTPNFTALSDLDLRGVVVTAKGSTCDFVSRCFFPKYHVNEDPVTGSAHCQLAPYWATQMNKTLLTAKQLSKRQGTVKCEIHGDRVLLTGSAVDYMKGTIKIR